MRLNSKHFSITLPVLGILKIEKLPHESSTWREAYSVIGEVDGEHRGVLIYVVKGLPHPVQARSELSNFSNIVWVPAEELELPMKKDTLEINLPPYSLHWDRLLEVFAKTYITETLLHEVLHLWVRFKSRYIDYYLKDEGEKLYNAIEDFLIQLLLLRNAKMAFKPSWTTSQQQLLAIDPHLIGKIHVIKVLQEIGCKLSGMEAYPHKDGASIFFRFSQPDLDVSRSGMVQEILLSELATYIRILNSLKPIPPRSLKIDVKLPASIQNMVINAVDETNMKGLTNCLIEVGNALIHKFTLKPFKNLHEKLVDFIERTTNAPLKN